MLLTVPQQAEQPSLSRHTVYYEHRLVQSPCVSFINNRGFILGCGRRRKKSGGGILQDLPQQGKIEAMVYFIDVVKRETQVKLSRSPWLATSRGLTLVYLPGAVSGYPRAWYRSVS